MGKIFKEHFIRRRRTWQPTPVFLPRESCGRRSLVGCCLPGHVQSDTTEVTRCACVHWRRKWQPIAVFLPGESQGQRSLVGCRRVRHSWSDLAAAATKANIFRLWGISNMNSQCSLKKPICCSSPFDLVSKKGHAMLCRKARLLVFKCQHHSMLAVWPVWPCEAAFISSASVS